MSVVSAADLEPATKPSLDDMIAAPERSLDLSITEQHSMSWEDIQTFHLGALQNHFAVMAEGVSALRRLAEEQDIDGIARIEDAGPLLMAHSVYKSYPLSFLEEGRFDQLTRWLDRLTTHDLSGLDASACESIDDWIVFLDRESPIRLKHSSGTTGKLSFVPRSKLEYPSVAKSIRLSYEGFGDEPDAWIKGFETLPVVSGGYRYGAMSQCRMLEATHDLFHHGDESMVLALNPGRISADVLSIAGRIRGAEERGELGALKISPALLARRQAFIDEQKLLPARMEAFIDTLAERWMGQRIVISGSTAQFFDMAELAAAKGYRHMFAPGALAMMGGGTKGRVIPDDYPERIRNFLGPDNYPRQGYGMSEMVSAMHRACPCGSYHLRPHVVPYLLDPVTGDQLPRSGVHTGRFAFVDLLTKTHWGGFISGDEVTLSWGDTPCACGRTGAYLAPAIRRYSEKEGGDDKITCSGAPEAHDKALEHLLRAAVE